MEMVGRVQLSDFHFFGDTARPRYKGLEGTGYFWFLYQLVLISRYIKSLDDNDSNDL